MELLPSAPQLNDTASPAASKQVADVPDLTLSDLGSLTTTNEQSSELLRTLNKFISCFRPGKQLPTTHLLKHHIDTGDSRPLSIAPHRASFKQNADSSRMIDDMLDQGIIQLSRSPWTSRVVVVTKKDGSLRFCVDYRRLNGVTTRDVYPLPRIDDSLHALGSAKFFSTLDLTSAYWQIELDDESRPKSAFLCRKGLFEFVRLPFGLSNTPATLQRLMDSVLAGLNWQSCLVYLDDIIIFSSTFEEHIQHLHQVLERITAAGLSIKLSKCLFASPEIDHLGPCPSLC